MEALVILDETTVFIVVLLFCTLAIISGFLMLWKIPVALKTGRPLKKFHSLSIIIPARNEENRLPRLLDSLMRQTKNNVEIIVVDDDSEDATVSIAQSYGIQVIQKITEEEWVGKSAACWQGAKKANGDWLMFLDADTCFEDENSLHQLLETYQAVGSSGILSFQPYHKMTHLYENLSVVFNIILMAGMNVFTPAGDRLKTAGSFGPCILCKREEYFITGGHKAIQGAIMDDLALGESFSEKDFPVRCYSGKGSIYFQMYPEGIRTLFEGWTKSFGTAAQSTHPLVTSLIASWISGSFLTLFALAIGANATNFTALVLAGFYCIIYLIQFYWLARRVGNFKFYALALYPILFVFFIGLFMWSLFLTKVLHRVRWRGRDVNV